MENVNTSELSSPTLALINGQALTSLPKDLYIPPDAMEVFLDAFEGPLDLLLYLIRKQNLDVLDIPIAEVTRQYMEYVEIMKEVSLELAAEYLVMAALLAEIKSRMLLPQPEINGQTEEDPRAELIRRLQEYERFKKAALDIDDLPRVGRDIFIAAALSDDIIFKTAEPTVHLQDILLALSDIMKRSLLTASHQIKLEPLSVRDRMSAILEKLSAHDFSDFTQFFTLTEGRLGVVVTFLAMLELLKSNLIQFVQAAPFGPIHLKATT